MRVRLLCWWLLLLLPWGAWADAAVWRVRTAEGVLYLAGSIHVLRAQDHPLPPEFDAAYADAQVLVLEAPLDEAAQQAAQQALLARGFYAEGDSLRRHLAPDIHARLEQYCAARGLPASRWERLKPWLLVMTLSVERMQAEGFDPRAGVDHYFAQRALRDGKPTHGLETMEEQIALLAGFDGEADALVANFLREAETASQTMQEMLGAWRRGDAAALDALLSREMRDTHPALYRALLVERNHRWLERLEQWGRSGQRVMVVVGAGHLAGDEGLVRLLQRRGYAVEKMALPAGR